MDAMGQNQFYAILVIWEGLPKSHILKIEHCHHHIIVGFLRGGVQGGGGNWGTLRIPREVWGTLGNIRED